MAKLRPLETRISLFPFLSVLTCTIGVLILIITLLAVGHLHAGPLVLATKQQKALQETYVRLHEASEQARTDIDDHNNLIAQAELLETQMRQLQQELERVQDRHSQYKLKVEELQRLNDELNRRTVDISDLEGRLQDARASRQALQKKVDDLPEPGTVRVVASRRYAGGVPDQVSSRRPVFLECRKEGIVCHPGTSVITESQIESGSALQSLLDSAASSGNNGTLLVFLVRPDGVPTYDKAARRVRQRENVRWGLLPVPGAGPIDLSVFFPATHGAVDSGD